MKQMTAAEFLNQMNSGKTCVAGSELHECMHGLSQRALEITARLNSSYHTPEEVREIMSD